MNIPKPDLNDSYLRVDRAKEHFTELEAAYWPAVQKYAAGIAVSTHPEFDFDPHNPPKEPLFSIETPSIDIPSILKIISGEVIYNLRCSLDYLVGQLALLDRDPFNEKQLGRNQFPICENSKEFRGIKPEHLAGVNGVHRTAIEALQPYNDNDWIMLLRTASNMDKHNKLIAVAPRLTLRYQFGPHPTEPDVLGLGLRPEVCFVIDAGEKTPLRPALQNLVEKVTEVLDQFKPEFVDP